MASSSPSLLVRRKSAHSSAQTSDSHPGEKAHGIAISSEREQESLVSVSNIEMGDAPNNLSPGHVPVATVHSVSNTSQKLSCGFIEEGKRRLAEEVEDNRVSGFASEVKDNTDGEKTDISRTKKVPGVQEIQDMLSAQSNLMHQQIEELKKVFTLQLDLTGINPLSQEMKVTMVGSKAGKELEDSITKDASQSLQNVFSIKDSNVKKEACDISVSVVDTCTQKKEAVQKESGIIRDVESCERLLMQMQSEGSFSGQAELLRVITRPDRASFLHMFLDKGGLQVLGKWLVKAAAEEQATLLRSLLQVLSSLPLGHATAGQMTSIVQAVNKLKSYGVRDIARHASTLLAKWSKLFGRRVIEKSFGSSSFDVVSSLRRQEASPGAVKRNRDQVAGQVESSSEKKRVRMENISQTDAKSGPISPLQTSLDKNQRNASVDVPKEMLSSTTISKIKQEIPVKVNSGNTPQKLDASMDASRKRLVPTYSKERRKVLLVDELANNSRRGKDVDVRKMVATDKFSRPLSADDIQKAKMRARLLQNLNAKQIATGSPDIRLHKPENFNVLQARERGLRSASLEGVPEPNRISNLIISPDVFDTPSNEYSSDQVHHRLTETSDAISSMSMAQDVALGEAKSGSRSGSSSKIAIGEGRSSQLQSGAKESIETMSPIRCLGFQSSLTQEEEEVGLLQDDAARVKGVSTLVNFIDDSQAQNQRGTGFDSKNGSPRAVLSLSIGLDGGGSKVLKEEISSQSAQPSQVLEQSYARVKFLSERTNWLPWSLPPEVILDSRWSIGAGEDSKEKGVQFDRVSREEEAFYLDSESIPENPKAPWDEEPDYDDSLTLEVPSDASVPEDAQQASLLPVYNPVVDELPSVEMQERGKPGWAHVSLAVSMACRNEAISQPFSGTKADSLKLPKANHQNYRATTASDLNSVLPQSTSPPPTVLNHQGTATTELKSALPQATTCSIRTSVSHQGIATRVVNCVPPQVIHSSHASVNHQGLPTSEAKSVLPQDTASLPTSVNHQGVVASEIKLPFLQATTSVPTNPNPLLANISGQSQSQVGVNSNDVINHDPELLAFLLRNPELLSKLTSQHAIAQERLHLSILSSSHETNSDSQRTGGRVHSSPSGMSVTNVTTPGLPNIAGFADHVNTITPFQSTPLSSGGFQQPPVQAQTANMPMPKSEKLFLPLPPLIMSGTAAVHIPFNSDRKVSMNGPYQAVSEWKPASVTVTMSSSASILAQASAQPSTGISRWPNSEHAPHLTGVTPSYTTISSRQTQLGASNSEENALRQTQYTGHVPPLPPDSRNSTPRTGFEEPPCEGSSVMSHTAYLSAQDKFIGRTHLPNVAHAAQEQANPLFPNPTPTYVSGSDRAMGDNDFIRRPDQVEVTTLASNHLGNVPVWMPNVGSSRPLFSPEVPFQHKQLSNIPQQVDSFNRPIFSTPITNVIVPPQQIPLPHVRWSNNPPRTPWRG